MVLNLLFSRADIARNLYPANAEPIAFNDAKIKFVTDRCRGKRVLDIGCVMHDPRSFNSKFFLHRAIQEVAASVVGLDLSEDGVRSMNARGCNVVVGDATSFSFDEKFDVVVAGDIIEHLANLEAFIQCVDNVLMPGGMLLVLTPNPWNWRNIAKSILGPEVPNNPEHTCWFCPRTWRQLCERYGYTLGTITHYSRYKREKFIPLPRGIRTSAWAAETIRSSS